MAPPTKSKNVVTKDSLRRLMKEKTVGSKASSTRIDHPCAKYNALEQLTCALCKTVIKNERLWNAHIMGRTHKEMIATLKNKANNQNVQAPPPNQQLSKRRMPDDDDDDIPMKKSKSNNGNSSKNSIPDDFFDSSSKPKSAMKKPGKPKSILKNATIKLPNYDDDKSDSEEMEEVPSTSGTPQASGVPSDFFDASTSAAAAVETKPLDASMAEQLPEGFFDDPKQDAQVRKVEYKDKMEEEWELFQKAMKEQNTVSDQILAEDDDIKTLERQVEEVDEQMHRWSQVHALAQKKETVMAGKDKATDENADAADSDSDVDADLDDLMDWRSKAAYKS